MLALIHEHEQILSFVGLRINKIKNWIPGTPVLIQTIGEKKIRYDRLTSYANNVTFEHHEFADSERNFPSSSIPSAVLRI